MTSRLLDALDSSMAVRDSPTLPSASPVLPTQPGQIGVPGASTPTLERLRALQAQAAMMRQSQAHSSTQIPPQYLNDLAFVATPHPRQASQLHDTGGFHLNYDSATPLKPIDVGGPDQSARMAAFVTKSMDNDTHGLTVRSARQKLGLRDERDLLPGMEVRLLPHQCIGVAWMVAQEKGEHKGGLLADDMGLGKTVQMIACMAMNMPDIDDETHTTLIVVPAALMEQWKEEILTKTNGIMSVRIHHGKYKLKKRAEVREYDVIITTYQTLAMDFGTPNDLDTEDEAEWLANNGGLMARMKFYRVIADEAQFIRNRATKASIALAHVRAKYRWMLTGTPVTNTLADLYGLLRFGRFRPFNDWPTFNDYVARVQSSDAPLAGQRAQAILKPIFIRRTKDSMLEGKPIIQLPPKYIEMVTLQFSKEEQEIYNAVESKTQVRVNKFIREGTVLKNHMFILVMILRLRQLCCHPNLALVVKDEFEDPEMKAEAEAAQELAKARRMKGASWVEALKAKFLKRALATECTDDADSDDDPTCPTCNDYITPAKGRILGCGHEICFDCLLDLRNSPIAHDGIFGHGDETQNAMIEKQFEEAEEKGYRPCPVCRKIQDVNQSKVFLSSAFAPANEELKAAARKRKRLEKAVNFDTKEDSDEGNDNHLKHQRIEDLAADDSDEDLPDASEILRPVKRAKTELEDSDDEDLPDPTMDGISGNRRSSTISDSSSIEILGTTTKSKGKAKANGKSKARRQIIQSSDSSDVEYVGISSKPNTPYSKPAKANDKGKGKTKAKGRGRTSANQMLSNISESVLETWRRGDDGLEPSTKMTKFIELLREWDAYGDKTICYSQWTSLLDLLERLLSRYGLRSVRFDGKMDKRSRDETLAQFKKSYGPKIILISTKSGGVGLNLVAANRIVNMDVSWNYATESQAYDRAHRIGQEKPVYVKRLIVENTIEERILKLQEVKVGLAEAALGEGSGNKLSKMSVKDIKFLFGMTKKPQAKKAQPSEPEPDATSDEEDGIEDMDEDPSDD